MITSFTAADPTALTEDRGVGGSTRKHYISVEGTAVMQPLIESALQYGSKERSEMSPMRHHDPPKAIVLRGMWPTTCGLPNL